MRTVLAIDQSTSGTKALLFTLDGKLLARADRAHRQITDARGWVEHDPAEIYENTLRAAKDVIDKSGISAGSVSAVGISNQRETAVCWSKTTGEPLYNAIVWQCARAADISGAVEAAGMASAVRERTGLTLSPFFSAAKWGWMVKHVPEVLNAQKNLTLCCGTVDSWLVYKLTGGHKTDYSNAGRTQLLDLRRLTWDVELAAAFGIDPLCLPELCFSDSLFGYTTLDGILPEQVPVHGVLGDSHAALYGNRCWKPLEAKATYGTGSSVMMNAGDEAPPLIDGVSTCIAWGMNGKVTYVLEGNINYTGAVTQWLAEDIGLLPDAKSAGVIAASVPDTGGVYLVPAFSGLGAPYFNNDARAAFLGMNRSTGKAHLIRAAEECIAYQIRDVVEAINAGLKQPLSVIRADGGPTGDGFLMQFQSDILNLPVEISQTKELSAMGAAFCAAVGAGLASREEIFAGKTWTRVEPGMDEAVRTKLYGGWKEAVKRINI